MHAETVGTLALYDWRNRQLVPRVLKRTDVFLNVLKRMNMFPSVLKRMDIPVLCAQTD